MIEYYEYVKEQLDKSISYSEYIAGQIDKSISWSDKNFERKKIRKNKIKNLFK
jgi:hypothetical protein